MSSFILFANMHCPKNSVLIWLKYVETVFIHTIDKHISVPIKSRALGWVLCIQ